MFWKNKITSFDVISEKYSMIGVAEDVFFDRFDGLADLSKLHNLVRKGLFKEGVDFLVFFNNWILKE